MYDKTPYFYGTGRRKSSVARVRLYKGTGKVTINDRDIDDNSETHCSSASRSHQYRGTVRRSMQSGRRWCNRSGRCNPSRHIPCTFAV